MIHTHYLFTIVDSRLSAKTSHKWSFLLWLETSAEEFILRLHKNCSLYQVFYIRNSCKNNTYLFQMERSIRLDMLSRCFLQTFFTIYYEMLFVFFLLRQKRRESMSHIELTAVCWMAINQNSTCYWNIHSNMPLDRWHWCFGGFLMLCVQTTFLL